MFMKLTVLAALAALLFTAGLTAQSTDGTMMKSDSSTADGTMMKSDDTMMKSDNTMMNSDNTMMKSDSTMMKSDASMMVSDADRKMSADPMDISAFNLKGLGNQVVAFKSEAAAQALAKKGTVVYFFAATWCPECQATYKDLKANFSMLPKNFTLVFVNYDKAKELKMKYGITAQHTFVQLGAMGEKKKVWSTSMTVGDLVQSTMM
jgi:thiol-disulfide isomerase/thioredoxin